MVDIQDDEYPVNIQCVTPVDLTTFDLVGSDVGIIITSNKLVFDHIPIGQRFALRKAMALSDFDLSYKIKLTEFSIPTELDRVGPRFSTLFTNVSDLERTYDSPLTDTLEVTFHSWRSGGDNPYRFVLIIDDSRPWSDPEGHIEHDGVELDIIYGINLTRRNNVIEISMVNENTGNLFWLGSLATECSLLFNYFMPFILFGSGSAEEYLSGEIYDFMLSC